MSTATIDITETVRERLLTLYEDHGGNLTPDIVIADARNKSSPLHSCFEWDVHKAAMGHWRSVARRLIRNVKIEWTTTEYTYEVPAYIAKPDKEHGEQGYLSIEDIRSDKQIAAAVMLDECRRMKSIIGRCEGISAALAVSPKLKRIAATVREIQKIAEAV